MESRQRGQRLINPTSIKMILRLTIARLDQSYATLFLGSGLSKEEYIIMAVFAGASSWMLIAAYVLISVTKSLLLECKYTFFGF